MSTYQILALIMNIFGAAMLILAQVFYWINVARGGVPVEGHLILWVSWLSIAALQVYFYWLDYFKNPPVALVKVGFYIAALGALVIMVYGYVVWIGSPHHEWIGHVVFWPVFAGLAFAAGRSVYLEFKR